MAGVFDNTIMLWNGVEVSDHGRGPLQQNTERVGTDKRMADGTLRRQHIGIKRTWQVSWENLPSTNTVSTGYKTVDGGMAGEDIEAFYFSQIQKFRMVLKRGSAVNLAVPSGASTAGAPFQDQNFYGVDVMITDFQKEVTKRGKVDFWNLSVTLEEV